MPLLTQDQITARLASLSGWEVREGLLTKTFDVRSFAHAVLFIGAIGQYAEAAGHHPDLSLRGYSHVTVQLTDHTDGGLTEKDFDLAEKIEAMPHKKLK